MSRLDDMAKIPTISRQNYGSDVDNKPNDHCNWQALLPTNCASMGWVENDAHFKDRIRGRIT